jgi:hypothetical protein
VGHSQRDALASNLIVLLTHLLKLAIAVRERPSDLVRAGRSWRTTCAPNVVCWTNAYAATRACAPLSLRNARRPMPWPGRHCQLNAKNLHISAGTRKLSPVFFSYDRLHFRHLYAVSFPHAEGVCERFFVTLTIPFPGRPPRGRRWAGGAPRGHARPGRLRQLGWRRLPDGTSLSQRRALLGCEDRRSLSAASTLVPSSVSG